MERNINSRLVAYAAAVSWREREPHVGLVEASFHSTQRALRIRCQSVVLQCAHLCLLQIVYAILTLAVHNHNPYPCPHPPIHPVPLLQPSTAAPHRNPPPATSPTAHVRCLFFLPICTTKALGLWSMPPAGQTPTTKPGVAVAGPQRKGWSGAMSGACGYVRETDSQGKQGALRGPETSGVGYSGRCSGDHYCSLEMQLASRGLPWSRMHMWVSYRFVAEKLLSTSIVIYSIASIERDSS